MMLTSRAARSYYFLSGTLPEPQPVEKVVRIQDSDFIPQAQTTSYGHDLRSNSFRQIYCVVVE